MDPKRRREQKGKDVVELEDFVPPTKKRLNELRSSKKSTMPPAEEQKGEIFSPQHPKLGSQHPCSVVSP